MPDVMFSANTGYLWSERPFLERIRQARRQGFHAVEFHDEAQSTDRAALRDVLAETGLPVVGLNVRMGGTFGCAAVAGARDQARRDIDEAIELAADIGAGAVHVLAGLTSDPQALSCYRDNLRHALAQSDLTILIEPICPQQVPGYALGTVGQAAAILAEIEHPRLKILFDCYHVHHVTGDVARTFEAHAAEIGHVQISAAENRAEPWPGALNYAELVPGFIARGYTGVFGCEYRPETDTDAGLGWRDQF